MQLIIKAHVGGPRTKVQVQSMSSLFSAKQLARDQFSFRAPGENNFCPLRPSLVVSRVARFSDKSEKNSRAQNILLLARGKVKGASTSVL